MFASLGDFLRRLEELGEVVRISEPVRIVGEIAEFADRASKARCIGEPSSSAKRVDPERWDRGGPAIVIERPMLPDGSIAPVPVVINAYGSYRRMELALGCEEGFDALGARIGSLAKPVPPRGLREALAKAREFAPLLRIGPKRTGRAPCQEVVRTGKDINVLELPVIRCWPHDGDFETLGYPGGINDDIEHVRAGDEDVRGRYITLAGIHTIHADDAGEKKPASHNIGMYRVQLLSENRVAMHWHIHHDGAAHWRSWKKKGEPMPVAIVLGGEAVLAYAATAPLPPGISELLMAGFLNGGGIKLADAKTVPLRVPANAEIVIEGYVRTDAGDIGWDPRETDEPLGPGAVFEGPFGDHTGFYSMPDRYPIVEVTAITHREKPIYPTTVVGLPPQEDYFLGKATERLFMPLLQVLIPDIVDYDLPMFGAFHNCAFLKVSKAYPMQARRVMHAVWGAGQMAWTKHLFVVDEDVDVHDVNAVLTAAGRWCAPGRDIETVRGPLDILDHAAPRLGVGTKLGFDCTRKWPGEEGRADWPLETGAAGTNMDRVRAVEGVAAADTLEPNGTWLAVVIRTQEDGDGRRVLRRVLETLGSDSGVRFVIGLSDGVAADDRDAALFHWCANSDAGRDLVRAGEGLMDPIGFDATAKTGGESHEGQPVRAWPPILEMDDRTRARVDELARTLGLEWALGTENPDRV